MKYVLGGPARVLLVSSLVAGSVVFLSPGPASAASCNPANPFARGDFDGDYRTDAVIGVPSYDGGAGGVDARGSHTSALVITPGMLLRGGAAGSGFGSAVALTDLDSDGCADLVVGAPGEDRKGAVHVLFGSPTGFTTMDTVTLAHDSREGDAFGSALALSPRKVGSEVVHDLYVGAPGADVGGKADAGEVFRYTIVKDADRKVKATFRERRHQGAGGVPDAAEAGDRFGAVLAGVEAGPPIKARQGQGRQTRQGPRVQRRRPRRHSRRGRRPGQGRGPGDVPADHRRRGDGRFGELDSGLRRHVGQGRARRPLRCGAELPEPVRGRRRPRARTSTVPRTPGPSNRSCARRPATRASPRPRPRSRRARSACRVPRRPATRSAPR